MVPDVPPATTSMALLAAVFGGHCSSPCCSALPHNKQASWQQPLRVLPAAGWWGLEAAVQLQHKHSSCCCCPGTGPY